MESEALAKSAVMKCTELPSSVILVISFSSSRRIVEVQSDYFEIHVIIILTYH